MPTGGCLGHPQGQSREAKPAPSRQVLIAGSGVFTCRCRRFPPDKNALDKQRSSLPAPGRWHPPSPLHAGVSPTLQVAPLREGHEAALLPTHPPPPLNLGVQVGDEPPHVPTRSMVGAVSEVRVNGGVCVTLGAVAPCTAQVPGQQGGLDPGVGRGGGCTPGNPYAGGWL